jgi:hypothetical protein
MPRAQVMEVLNANWGLGWEKRFQNLKIGVRIID